MATLGEIIKNFRESKNPKISMDTFSDLSGLSKSYISMLERNKDPRGNPIIPTIETIDKVAKAMEASFDDIFKQLDRDTLVRVNPPKPNFSRASDNPKLASPIRQPKIDYDYDYERSYYLKDYEEITKLNKKIIRDIKKFNLEGLQLLDNQIEMMIKSKMYDRKEHRL